MSDARSEEEYERTEAHGETSRARRAFLKGGVASIVDLPVGAVFFPTKSFAHPAVGPSASFLTSSIGTSSIAAVTSRRSSNRRFSIE
jgi:hypothetical protein